MQNQKVADFVKEKLQQDMSLTAVAEAMTTNCLAENALDGIGCDNMTVIIIAILNGKTYEEWHRSIKESPPVVASG
jgi:serine/threonine protein phosphatase PrpC